MESKTYIVGFNDSSPIRNASAYEVARWKDRTDIKFTYPSEYHWRPSGERRQKITCPLTFEQEKELVNHNEYGINYIMNPSEDIILYLKIENLTA